MHKSSKEIRQTFLNYFSSLEHKIVPSAPMVIQNDSTLMFTNAGMNQFKDLFLGNEPITEKRITDTQKCLRVSGKHNDLEEVGRDFDVTRERIRQIEAKALRKLRHPIRNKKLKSFVEY